MYEPPRIRFQFYYTQTLSMIAGNPNAPNSCFPMCETMHTLSTTPFNVPTLLVQIQQFQVYSQVCACIRVPAGRIDTLGGRWR